jgi:hypothetical protein
MCRVRPIRKALGQGPEDPFKDGRVSVPMRNKKGFEVETILEPAYP